MAVCPNQHDATSFYRGMGPLISLMKSMDNLEVTNALDQSWGSLKYTDIVFLQRPHLEECVTLAERAKQAGKLLWVDHDDCLLALPQSNPHKNIYYREDIQDNIVDCLRAADVVTVSTPALKDAYSKFNSNIVVIPNAWDDDLFPMPKLTNKHPKRIMWRGSSTHDEDLMGVLISLQSLSQDPSIDLQLVGDPFWLALKTIGGDRYKHHQWKGDILDYFNLIKRLAPNVLIVPLADNTFNRCKSNIAWLEAAWAGAMTVAPMWDEWKRPGVFNYTNDFKSQVDNALVYHRREAVLAREYIKDNLRLSKVNDLRKAIILGT